MPALTITNSSMVDNAQLLEGVGHGGGAIFTEEFFRYDSMNFIGNTAAGDGALARFQSA